MLNYGLETALGNKRIYCFINRLYGEEKAVFLINTNL